jgi:hypothetical protein
MSIFLELQIKLLEKDRLQLREEIIKLNLKKNTENSNELYTLLPDVFDEIISYIEEMEQTVDGEWGSGRLLKELIKDEDMPYLYNKLIALKNDR